MDDEPGQDFVCLIAGPNGAIRDGAIIVISGNSGSTYAEGYGPVIGGKPDLAARGVGTPLLRVPLYEWSHGTVVRGHTYWRISDHRMTSVGTVNTHLERRFCESTDDRRGPSLEVRAEVPNEVSSWMTVDVSVRVTAWNGEGDPRQSAGLSPGEFRVSAWTHEVAERGTATTRCVLRFDGDGGFRAAGPNRSTRACSFLTDDSSFPVFSDLRHRESLETLENPYRSAL